MSSISDSSEYLSEEDDHNPVDSYSTSNCTSTSGDEDEVLDIAEQFHCEPLIACPPQVLETSNVIKTLPGLPIQMKHNGFRLCGDNLDKNVDRHHLRSDKRNQSLHYFHAYAVENRIDVSQLSDVCPNISEITDIENAAKSMLPKHRDDLFIKENIAVLISRVLYQNIDFFKLSFDGVIDWHIKHKHYTEMSCKSVVVSMFKKINHYFIYYNVLIGSIRYYSTK